MLLNVTAVGADGAGFATVYPCGSPRPLASNLNYNGDTTTNLVSAKVGDGGRVCIYTQTSTHLVADRERVLPGRDHRHCRLIPVGPGTGWTTTPFPARVRPIRHPTLEARCRSETSWRWAQRSWPSRSSRGRTWNEWHALFDTGRSGWLSEDNGQYVFSFDSIPAVPLPPASDLRPGQGLTLGGRSWSVGAVTRAEILSGEGELPGTPAFGQLHTVVELRNAQGEVASWAVPATATRLNGEPQDVAVAGQLGLDVNRHGTPPGSCGACRGRGPTTWRANWPTRLHQHLVAQGWVRRGAGRDVVVTPVQGNRN